MERYNNARVIAFYLPQYHPIPENDEWWGKGFTDWTNVGNAKPLFKGHYQPKVPAYLGYYDLRFRESRIAQAKLAREYGIEGFCYWHYWFGNGRQLLERPFNEVLKSGEPDFPFCLGWANHSWHKKTFNKSGKDKLLIKQVYTGNDDYIKHFESVLPAFKDHRYILVDGKPLFLIYDPFDLPDISKFILLWNNLAKDNDLEGIYFVALTDNVSNIPILREFGFDAINILRLFHFVKNDFSLIDRINMKIKRKVFHIGRIIDYSLASKSFSGVEDSLDYCYPTIIPNWDHSPRSGRNGHILVNSNPKIFSSHVRTVFNTIKKKDKEHRIVFLKSWNEWGEGNYVEPDLKYGRGFLEVLKQEIDSLE